MKRKEAKYLPTRRAFFAALFAPVAARVLPRPQPPSFFPSPGYAFRLQQAGPKIGDTIRVRRPPSFIVHDGPSYQPSGVRSHFDEVLVTVSDGEMRRRELLARAV